MASGIYNVGGFLLLTGASGLLRILVDQGTGGMEYVTPTATQLLGPFG